MNQIPTLFDNPVLNLKRLQDIEALPEPRSRYIIAITPRSGSTYLCDMMMKTKRLGTPQEVLGQLSINNRLKNIPGRTPDEYIRNAIRVKRTANDVSGLKASWFQFQNFMEAMDDQSYLAGFKYIYLTRRDLFAQAVSLYKATASSVFHTNKQHSEEELSQLNALEYDYDMIKNWYGHIAAQEKGWQQYFYNKRIFPLCITYEDIEDDILTVLKRIATYVAVNPENIAISAEPSVFKRISDSRNADWSNRFILEHRLTDGINN
ncbi:MAG: Stf0 family sulfotransferase [Methylovulum sp.]|nr:Stf0 family sulfotransferase [Methylovulum sp.]